MGSIAKELGGGGIYNLISVAEILKAVDEILLTAELACQSTAIAGSI